MATIKDIAVLSNCSSCTVSMVLNGKAGKRVSDATRERILQAAKQLNYVPNIAAKRLKTVRNEQYSIAVFWPKDYRFSFLSRLLVGMQKTIDTSDVRLNIIICPYENDHLRESLDQVSSFEFHGALIGAASDLDMEYLESHDLPIPIVLLNRSSEKYSTVGCDNYNAGRLAAMHLIGRGCKSIATVFTKSVRPAMTGHQHGFTETWEAQIGPIARQYHCSDTITDGYNAAAEVLSGDLPDAIFADTDAIAQGLLCGAEERGIRIPEDVAILSIGQYMPEVSAHSVPPLTTVEIPHELFAQHGLLLLISAIKKEMTSPCHLLFDVNLMVRRSCP